MGTRRMKRLEMPEPAGSLLGKLHRLFAEQLPKALEPGTTWTLGGGTVLAARWGHRESADIDIKLGDGNTLRRLREEENPDFVAGLKAAGATKMERDSDQLWRITFKAGRLDLGVGPTTPQEGAEIVETQSGRIEVLSNAQILCGKLKNRALRAPVRDLFDVAVAARRDPRALTIAANAMPEQVFRKFKKIWAENRTNYGFEQRFHLKGVPPEYGREKNNAADCAAAAIEKHRYRALSIEVTGQGIEVRTAGGTGRARYLYATRKEGRRGFDMDGVNAALEARNRKPSKIWRSARIKLQAGTTGAVYDERFETGKAAGMPALGNAGWKKIEID